jgi:hypothetical protein
VPVNLDVFVFIELELIAKRFDIRRDSNSDEDPFGLNRLLSTGADIFDNQSFDFLIAFDRLDQRVRDDRDARVLLRLFEPLVARAKVVGTVNERDMRADAREDQTVLDLSSPGMPSLRLRAPVAMMIAPPWMIAPLHCSRRSRRPTSSIRQPLR